jgi:hypothetical protein
MGRFWPNFVLGRFWPSFFWARPGPIFLGFVLFPRVFLCLFLLVLEYIFMSLKIQNLVLKYTVFIKTFKNTKKFENRKNVFVHTAKSLKAKKNHIVFFIRQKTMF